MNSNNSPKRLVLKLPWLEMIAKIHGDILSEILKYITMSDLMAMVVAEYPIRHPYYLEDFDYQYTLITLEEIVGEENFKDVDLISEILDTINSLVYDSLFKELGDYSDKYIPQAYIGTGNVVIFVRVDD